MLALLPLQWIHAADSPVDPRDMEAKLEAAQQRLDAAAREVADLSMSLSDQVMPRDMLIMSRQRSQLGIAIGRPEDDARRDGVEILSLSPGGGAAAAGLQVADVLTEVNGKSLQQKGKGSSPRAQLLAALRETEPGEKVTVTYKRGDKNASATIVTQAAARPAFDLPIPPASLSAFGPAHVLLRDSKGIFGAAELAPLTPKLGEYFGTDKGLLVIRGPGDDRLKLEEGDVIVDIDGRIPESPAHAARILDSYEPGEKLRLNVLRMKKHLILDVEVPADARRQKIQRRLEGAHFPEHPAVPAPVVMPLPPRRVVGWQSSAEPI
jgi:hypothetical protein